MKDDLRQAARALRAAPVVTAVALLSLALGVGANTAVFSVVNGLLLRPLPVTSPDRLVTVSSDFAVRQGFKAGLGTSYAMWQRFDVRSAGFAGGFAWAPAVLDLSQGGERQPAHALIASGGFFDTLGVRALIGRTLTAADDVIGGGADGPVVVISYGLWQRRFGGAADVLGTALPVNGVACTIVGVTPAGFFGVEVGQPFDLVLPLGIDPLLRGAASLHNPASLMLTVMLRLGADQSLDAAAASLRTMQPQVLEAVSGGGKRLPAFLREPFTAVPASTGTSDRLGLRGQYRQPLLVIFAVVALVLLIACANVANLFLARAAERRHELSVRLALGASRWRLARQMLAESLLFAAVATALGVIFSRWASRAIVAAVSTADTPAALEVSIDWRVLAFTAGVALTTAVFFGVRPAMRVGGVAPAGALTRRLGGSQERGVLSRGLVVVQVALSLVLVVVAALLVGTFERLVRVPLGFDADRVLVVNVDTSRAHTDSSTREAYFDRLVAIVAGVPGVERAAGSRITPLASEAKAPLNADPARVMLHVITPGWFEVYGTARRAGRDFTAQDAAGAPRVAIVNESYVRRFIPDGHALGALVKDGPCGDGDGRCAIVGVVGDAVFGSVRGARQAAVYVPMAQAIGYGVPGRTRVSISVRAGRGPARLGPSIGAALTSLDRSLSFSFRPLAEDVASALVRERLVAAVAAFFGVLALVLAGLGLFGVAAYTVTRQRVEIGIRLALGATPGRVVRDVLRHVAVMVAAGLALGVVVTVSTTRFLAALLFGLQPRDPLSLAAGVAIVAVVGLLAAWLPAVRAATLDPASVLRHS